MQVSLRYSYLSLDLQVVEHSEGEVASVSNPEEVELDKTLSLLRLKLAEVENLASVYFLTKPEPLCFGVKEQAELARIRRETRSLEMDVQRHKRPAQTLQSVASQLPGKGNFTHFPPISPLLNKLGNAFRRTGRSSIPTSGIN